MKIRKKFLFVLIVINILVNLVCLSKFYVEATGTASNFTSKLESDASSFITSGATAANGKSKQVITSITSQFTGVGQFLTMIGAGVMVAVVSYMGIKYIMSPPDKQAALKQQLIGVVAAGIVIFGAVGIWKAVLGVVSNF